MQVLRLPPRDGVVVRQNAFGLLRLKFTSLSVQGLAYRYLPNTGLPARGRADDCFCQPGRSSSRIRAYQD